MSDDKQKNLDEHGNESNVLKTFDIMTGNQQKNSDKRNMGSSVLKTFVITVIILFVPTVGMWIFAVLSGLDWDSINGYGKQPSNNLNNDWANLGQAIACYLPVIGIFSAAFSSWFVVRILKMRDIFAAAFLNSIITGGVLVAVYIATTRLLAMGYNM
jgi:hypothetical protein